MRKIKSGMLIVILLCSLTACGEYAASHTETSEETQAEPLIPVASFIKSDVNLRNSRDLWLQGEYLYYIRYLWNADKQFSESTVLRQNMPDTGEPEILMEKKEPGDQLICFVPDRNGNCYYFGYRMRDSDMVYSIEKRDGLGRTVYDTELEYEELSVVEGTSITGGIADENGNLCLFSQDGSLYFRGPDGKSTGKTKFQGKIDGMADAGVDGIYLFQMQETETLLFRIEFAKAAVSRECDGRIPYANPDSPWLFSGFEDGLYVSKGGELWQYHPSSNEFNRMFGWKDSYVNVDAFWIRQISRLSDGRILAFTSDYMSGKSEAAVIRMTEPGTLPKRRVMTLGVVSHDEENDAKLLECIREFNRQSLEWMVEIKQYHTGSRYPDSESTQKFYLDLIQGNGPDLISLKEINIAPLVSKGVLEDLEPYFAGSESARKEDMLYSIWRSGYVNGRLAGITPWFSLNVMVIREGGRDAGWTLEEYLELPEKCDTKYLQEYMSPSHILWLIWQNGKEQFVNYEEGTCNFAGDRFLSLLEKIKALDYRPQPDTGIEIETGSQRIERFLSGDYLLDTSQISSMQYFLELKKAYGDKVSFIGNPTGTGEPGYTLYGGCTLGINSASAYKEGAWEFIEYLLSEQVQSWKYPVGSDFPARKDAFSKYLTEFDTTDPLYAFADVEVTREDIEQLTFMADHARIIDGSSGDQIGMILEEESSYYFEGAKSAEEVADVIQNRVEIYLKEMKE